MKLSVLAVLLLAVGSSFAQITPRNILGTRYSPEAVRAALLPRGTWNAYPRTPEAWRAALPDSVEIELIRIGEAAAAKEFKPIPATLTLEYVRSGDRERYQGVSFSKRNQLLDLVLAESVEGKGRFLDAILNGVWSTCEESYWGLPAHIGTQRAGSGLPDVQDRTVDLFAAETAALLALTDYFVGDKLNTISKLVRPRIYHEVNERIFKPLSEQPERYGYLKPGTKVNNWNPWIMSNWLAAALLIEPDEARRADMTYRAMKGLDLYINGLGEDGGTDEGPSYWFVAGASVFDALELLHGASGGKLDVFGEPIIRRMASYIYKLHIAGDYFVDFADADPTQWPDGLMLYRFGKAVRDDTLTQFGAWAARALPKKKVVYQFTRPRQVQNLLTMREVPERVPPFRGVRDAWFADVQVMTARTDDGLFVATHGGHNAESHNHNDVGDFILYADGQPVVIDVGRGTYTARTFSNQRYTLWFNRSEFHNLPIINGLGQPAGRSFEARNVRYASSPTSTSLTMDLAGAYPQQAGVQSWNRVVNLNRTRNALEVRDDFVFGKKPGTLQQAFLTISTLNTDTPGRIVFQNPGHRPVVLTYDAKRWKVHVEQVPLKTPDDEAFKTSWGGKPIQRILLNAIQPVQKGRNQFTFSLGK